MAQPNYSGGVSTVGEAVVISFDNQVISFSTGWFTNYANDQNYLKVTELLIPKALKNQCNKI